MTDKLIPGSRAAALLRVSRPTIARWIREGRLEGFVEARTTRVWLSGVLEKLKRQHVAPEHQAALEAEHTRKVRNPGAIPAPAQTA